MAWETVSKYSIRNGSYSVSSSYTQGTPVYSAWPPKPTYRPLDWRASLHSCIGCFPTVEQAKAACITHAAMTALSSFACRLSGNHTTASG